MAAAAITEGGVASKRYSNVPTPSRYFPVVLDSRS